jgi:hypothetical protein
MAEILPKQYKTLTNQSNYYCKIEFQFLDFRGHKEEVRAYATEPVRERCPRKHHQQAYHRRLGLYAKKG